MTCDVCNGTLVYPIHNRQGREVMTIRCPQCDGGYLADEDDREPCPYEIPSTAASARTIVDLAPWQFSERDKR